MKGYSQLIVFAVCAVLCTGMLRLFGVFDSEESYGLSGWTPSGVYEGFITKDTSVHTAVAVERPSTNVAHRDMSVPSMTGGMRHKSAVGLSTPRIATKSMLSSYTAAPLRAVSSASYRSFGGGGYASGANNTFVFNQFKMAKSSPVGMSAMPNLSYASSSATSRVYSSAQMTTNAYSYAVPSMEVSAPRGIHGRRNAGVGFGDIWSDWLWGLHDDGDGTGAWMYDSGDNYYYNSSKLREAFAAWFSSNSSSFQGMTEEEAWLLFLEWFAPKDSDGNLLDTDHNFRFPISDGLGVMAVLVLLYSCVLYFKLRRKKTTC